MNNLVEVCIIVYSQRKNVLTVTADWDLLTIGWMPNMVCEEIRQLVRVWRKPRRGCSEQISIVVPNTLLKCAKRTGIGWCYTCRPTLFMFDPITNCFTGHMWDALSYLNIFAHVIIQITSTTISTQNPGMQLLEHVSSGIVVKSRRGVNIKIARCAHCRRTVRAKNASYTMFWVVLSQHQNTECNSEDSRGQSSQKQYKRSMSFWRMSGT